MLKKFVTVLTAFMVVFAAGSFVFTDNVAAKSYKSGKNHLLQAQVKIQK